VPVRRLTTDDIDLLRTIRLEALRTDPDAFGSTLEREESRSDDDWGAWLSRCATFVSEEAREAVGLAGGMIDEADGDRAVLISMWVAPASRGRGVGSALVNAVVEWAATAGKQRVDLLVIEGNAAAIALYEKCAFTFTGEQVHRDRDHAVELMMTRRLG
jgi:ribosomal protein S18 acetylase RimI-like enzyme